MGERELERVLFSLIECSCFLFVGSSMNDEEEAFDRLVS